MYRVAWRISFGIHIQSLYRTVVRNKDWKVDALNAKTWQEKSVMLTGFDEL